MTDEQFTESYKQQVLKIEKYDWVKYFLDMDIDNPQLFTNPIYNVINESFVQDNWAYLSKVIFELKNEIGLLSDKNKLREINNKIDDLESKLNGLKNLKNALSSAKSGAKMAQAHYEDTFQYLEFLKTLKTHFKQKVSSLEEKNNFIINTNFDLTAYPLTATGTHPYFLIRKETDFFYIYDGQIGQNKFAFYKIISGSEAGEKCDIFYDNYVTKNEHRFNYSEDIQALKSFIEDKAAEKLTGLEAYLKYYFEALPIGDKLNNGFYTIQHFEALKDWFNLVLENHNKKNEIHYSTKEIKEAEIRKFTTDTLQKVNDYLLPHTKVISRATAAEFIKFYEWLNESLNPKVIDSKKPAKKLKDIFNPLYNGYDVCIELMEYLGVTDNNGGVIMSDFKIFPLVAILIAFKKSKYLTKENLPEKTIIEYFNSHLNKEYKTLKKTATEYNETLIDAENYISTHIRKLEK